MRRLGHPDRERRLRKSSTATYVLIHGAGDVGWYWHLVEAIGRRRKDLIVVAQSFGGYVAPIVCDRVPVRLLVLVAAMVPVPGESAEEMFANTGYAPRKRKDSSDRAIFYHDVGAKLASEALARGPAVHSVMYPPGSDGVGRRERQLHPMPRGAI